MISSYNKVRIEGNSIYITGNPIGGLLGTFTAFGGDDSSGETIEDYFIEKSFRFSKNGIEFSEWFELTSPNISIISFDRLDTPVFEFHYKRSLPSGQADISEVQLQFNATEVDLLTDFYKNTIFNFFFKTNDPVVLNWTISVLNKIYDKGLLATFVSRKNINNDIEDFITLWKTVAQFFAFYVIYMRKFERFYEDKTLLIEYLSQRNIAVSDNESIEDLYLIMNTFYNKISHRGTIKIIDNKILSEKEIDGEFLRLIQYKIDNEFLFNLHRPQNFGWNLGSSSPLFRGLHMQDSLIKSTMSPIASDIVINSAMNYQAVFMVQVPNNYRLKITATSKDKNGDSVPLYAGDTGSIITVPLNNFLYRSDKVMLIRVCFYNYQKQPDPNDTLNINFGANIILNENSRTLTIKTSLNQIGELDSDFTTDFKFLPLFTEYSHGLLQVYNWISCWIENNNKSLTRNEVQDYVRRFLIPYNSTIYIKSIDSTNAYNTPQEITPPITQELAWRPVQSYCKYESITRETVWIGREETSYCEQQD